MKYISVYRAGKSDRLFVVYLRCRRRKANLIHCKGERRRNAVAIPNVTRATIEVRPPQSYDDRGGSVATSSTTAATRGYLRPAVIRRTDWGAVIQLNGRRARA